MVSFGAGHIALVIAQGNIPEMHVRMTVELEPWKFGAQCSNYCAMVCAHLRDDIKLQNRKDIANAGSSHDQDEWPVISLVLSMTKPAIDVLVY